MLEQTELLCKDNSKYFNRLWAQSMPYKIEVQRSTFKKKPFCDFQADRVLFWFDFGFGVKFARNLSGN